MTYVYQMGQEGNTTVDREGKASNAINPSLWPSLITDSISMASVQLLTVLLQPSLATDSTTSTASVWLPTVLLQSQSDTDSTTTASVWILTVLLQPHSHYWWYSITTLSVSVLTVLLLLWDITSSSTLAHAGEWQCIHAQHCILAGCAGVLHSKMNHGQFWHLHGEIHFLIPSWVETWKQNTTTIKYHKLSSQFCYQSINS